MLLLDWPYLMESYLAALWGDVRSGVQRTKRQQHQEVVISSGSCDVRAQGQSQESVHIGVDDG